ncbi:hypothetical protein CTI12_AA548870 [Artemisia annua]|uniref:Transposase, Ptta/En/Spm n=1 Tax=Artemisia annua TaxID=35608 RepID=A0A2U1KZ93_ARTAN|nr:hypothetical protein CTI12_AA548870 [Artemisia annua]
MACVAPSYHGGDAGGDPPEDRQPKRLPYHCEGSGKRGPNKHKALKKKFKENNNQPLEIEFDLGDLKTFKLVGSNAAHLTTYIVELVRQIPMDYESWEKVPAADKATIIPNLQRYFDLQSHFRDHTLIQVKGEQRTVGSLVRDGLEKDFAGRYSDNKYKFKKRCLTKAGSIEAARRMKLPEWKAGDDAWQKLVDFWAGPKRMEQSERNSKNRSKIKVTTHQGSKSFAQGRHEFGEMKAIQKAIKEKKMDPKTDRESVNEVLKSHNRGHIAGVGRVVPGTGSSCRSSQADQAFCTREEVEEMKKKHAMELEEQRKAFESRDNLFKQFLDFYNSQQGTPTSQFQIPDSYTPMFPGSTYTQGGPTLGLVDFLRKKFRKKPGIAAMLLLIFFLHMYF